MATLWCKFRNALRAFGRAHDGNVAVIFGIAAIPLIGFVGAAVDYGHANVVKTAMQAALDSTALMLSREASTLSQADLNSKALAYFNAMFNRSDVQPGTLTINAVYSTTGGTSVTVTGNVYVPTSFVTVIGFPQIDVGASSTAKWGSNRLRVALVLDNTGSMADAGKIDALKTATTNLLTQLKNAASVDGDVYVSIIPFVKDVNLDSANWSSNWIYWGTLLQDPTLSDSTSWDANNGTCSRGSAFTDRGACVAFPACSNSQFTKKKQCTNKGGTWYITPGIWTAKNHNTWNGCVMDRGYPASPGNLAGKSGPDATYNYDTNAGSPDILKVSSLYAAEQYSSCPQAAVGLNYNWASMTNLVNNMSPAGNTNQAIGLQVGWLSLAGGGPFSVPAMDPNYQYSQVIILLTDGLNTQDRWYSDQSSIDARQQLTCNNIKAAGITLYAIQVNTGGDPTSTLLQACATDSSKFFLLTSADQMLTTFESIGTNLTKLRVAQ